MNTIKSILTLITLLSFSQCQANIHSHFEQIKNNPTALYEFFKNMPKGGELHYHLAGGPYAEIMLELISKGDYCLNTKTLAVSKNSTNCNGIATKDILNQPQLYAKIIKSWSLKDFVPGAESSHEHFFNTFTKFMFIMFDYRPELIAEVIKVAAKQHEEYLELMILPDNGNSIHFGDFLKNAPSFEQKRQILLANKEFQKNIDYTVTESERVLEQAHQELGCSDTPQSENCQVTIKFLYYSSLYTTKF